ncbi:putative fatty acyl-CoA reductase CG5065 isoform X1 [Rhynchophorus ferrugineus]|uniref:putative fatty acyl-CoA reductase CG5065 isoform X1 n=2 Tax=Rhynchophorus ferrugineus TaxID=354439 RepID=UPI003FCE22EE
MSKCDLSAARNQETNSEIIMTGSKKITIPQYFKGKKIFITGGSGFIGKVLIELLLRLCPDVSTVYVLIRPKKGKTPEERIKQILDLPLFERLKKEYPENVKKIVPVTGDVTELNLGLTTKSRKLLIEEVNIVYNCAASVRFDDDLKDAILLNTRGTRETVLLAKAMKHLELFLHISTAYCQADKQVIEEKIYPTAADQNESIKLAENCDSHTLSILTSKYIHPLPNTYTFSKALSEQVINDLCNGQIPAAICRPSIVISTLNQPFPGWVDNFNGPVGLLAASGKGILRSIYSRPDLTADYMPVDIICKGLLVLTWKKGLETNNEDKLKLDVFNASNNNINNVTTGEMIDMGADLSWKYPLSDILWYPNGSITTCMFYHYIRVIFYHILPALVVDGLLILIGKKPMLLKVQRKIYIANMALQYFVTQEWKFINEKGSQLESEILPEDVDNFGFCRDSDAYEYFKNSLLGARQHLLKDDLSTLPRARVNYKRMYALYLICNTVIYVGLAYLFFFKYNVIGFIYRYVMSYFISL